MSTTSKFISEHGSNTQMGRSASHRAESLATRIEEGAAGLEAFAEQLSDVEWHTPVSPTDKRSIGVIVHHVATMYPIEIGVARAIASGQSVSDVTWEVVASINRDHEETNDGATKQDTLALLARNSAAAAEAIRDFTLEELDRAAPVSLNSGAPLTCQFVLEDHAVRHSCHHLAGTRASLAR